MGIAKYSFSKGVNCWFSPERINQIPTKKKEEAEDKENEHENENVAYANVRNSAKILRNCMDAH